jgi:protein-tyrosine phosphatase
MHAPHVAYVLPSDASWQCGRHACAGVSVANLAKSMEFVQAQRRLGRAILVHCAHGHGRSAQVLLACMIALGFYKTHQEGLAALQKLRPKCKLNRPQLRNLELYLGGVGLLQK